MGSLCGEAFSRPQDPDRHHGGPPGATAGKFTVGHKSTRCQIVRDTVDQHQSSVKCRSVLLGSAQQVRV